MSARDGSFLHGFLVSLLIISGFVLLFPSSSIALQVQDSPLYTERLAGALADLSEPSPTAAPWVLNGVGRSVANAIVPAAFAQNPPQTVYGEKGTVCQYNGKKYTRCGRSTNRTQVCNPTVHSQRKTECNGPNDKSVCKDQGTRCPGKGDQNQCLTNQPGQVTHCKKKDKPTLCLGEPTKCAPADENRCYTFGVNKKTACYTGQQVPTLCKDEPTGCSSAGKNVCKTFRTSDLTSCISSSHITMCNWAQTNCTGDKINDGCDYYNVGLSPLDPVGGHDVLIVAEVADTAWFFVDEPLIDILFTPAGPVMTSATMFDSTTAYYYVDFPDTGSFGVQLINGIDPPMDAPPIAMAPPIPTLQALGLLLMIGLLLGFGLYIVIVNRRRRAALGLGA